jgi:hypothetical protein
MESLLGKLGVILIGLAIFGCAEMRGTEWRPYSFNEVGQNYYDAHNLTRPSKKIVRVWERTNYTQKGVGDWVGKFGEKYANLSYSISLEEINCAEKTQRFLSEHFYDRNRKLILSDSSQTEWLLIVPGSIAEGLYLKICE